MYEASGFQYSVVYQFRFLATILWSVFLLQCQEEGVRKKNSYLIISLIILIQLVFVQSLDSVFIKRVRNSNSFRTSVLVHIHLISGLQFSLKQQESRSILGELLYLDVEVISRVCCSYVLICLFMSSSSQGGRTVSRILLIPSLMSISLYCIVLSTSCIFPYLFSVQISQV